MDENELKKVIAENISIYRKHNNMTQIQMAEALNYSDKAISKWERGESIPDIYVLIQVANLFGIEINDLISEPKKKITSNRTNKNVITLLSIALTWVVASAVFSLLIAFPKTHDFAWLSFIYALTASAIVYLVLSAVWKKRLRVLIGESLLFYFAPLSICCSLSFKYNSWSIFFIAIPLQVLALLWYFRKK